MVGSGLPRSILGNIWSLVNCTFPGQLTRQEFFACLALIALVQVIIILLLKLTDKNFKLFHFFACIVNLYSFSQR